MNALTVAPAEISGVATAPASKSDAQRAIAAAALASGTSEIDRFTPCADSLAALSVAAGLGADVARRGSRLTIRGRRRPPQKLLDCGESGLCLRLFAPIAALHDCAITLQAHGSLLARPVTMLEMALPHLGVDVSSRGGRPPLTVRGPLQGGRLCVDGGASSQHVSGLLFALPLAEADSHLEVTDAKSRPYLHLTLATLRRFGIAVESAADLNSFSIPGRQIYQACAYAIEGDWSAAAFLLVAGAIAGAVTVANLKADSPQADRAVLEALSACGAEVGVEDDRVTVKKRRLRAFTFAADEAPDLFPPLVALACHCHGTSRISGSDRLKNKESDRAAALVGEFAKLGGRIVERDNGLEVTGPGLAGGAVHCHDDHRIAMAAAVAGLASRAGVSLDQPGCVAKSYPDFFRDLGALSARNREMKT